MIAKWCKNNGIKLPESKYNEDEAWSMATKDHFLSLLEKMSSTLPEQKQAARELRLLTKRTPSTRALFSEFGDAVKHLITPLCQSSRSNADVDQDLKEDIITTILNISIHDNNKQLVAETPTVIPMLVDAVRSGTIQIRSNAAAAIFTLCALDSNKVLIGKSDALKPLIELLDEGHSLGMKDAACAIFNLCILHENKMRAVRDGAVEVIMKKIKDRMQVDELLSILAMLSTNQMAIEQMIELSAVTCLLSIMKDTPDAKNKENCIAILYTLCTRDQATWKELREEEEKHRTISQLAKDGNSRARRKAEGILDRFLRAAHVTHSA